MELEDAEIGMDLRNWQSDCHLDAKSSVFDRHSRSAGICARNSVSVGRTVRYVSIILASGLALGLFARRVDGQVRVIDPNGLYPAGTRLSSPLTGIAFRLPDGFRAEWDPELGGLVAQSHAGAFGAVWAWAEGTTEEVAAEVGTRLEAQGITLQARDGAEIGPDGMHGVFDASTDLGRGVLHVLIREGPSGGVVAITGLGAGDAERSAASFVDEVLASLEWTQPRAARWMQRIVGSALVQQASGASRTPSGPATLSFCTAGEYAYSGSATDRHAGRWWLVADLGGTSRLILETTDGRTLEWTVEESGEGFLIDGRPYRVTDSC